MLDQYFSENQAKLLRFILGRMKDGREDLPSIQELSELLEMSVPTLREQLEVLKMLGLLDARPRHGLSIHFLDCSAGLRNTALIAASIDRKYFYQFSDLRDKVEQAWFITAAEKLDNSDIEKLQKCVNRAKEKLNGNPIQIPYQEHKELHLSIYEKLDNVFVSGILSTYWTLYEAVGMNLYTDLAYQQKVWDFHGEIIGAIRSGELEKGLHLLEDHMKLLYMR